MVAVPRAPHLFGSRTRDRLLTLLAAGGEFHVRGAARALDVSPSEVAKAVASLEKIGVVASRLVGSTRFVSLNRRWYAAAELRPLLDRLAVADLGLRDIVDRQRTRPRRVGKPL